MRLLRCKKDLEYNRYGDHDPDGLLFVPMSQVEDIRCGRKKPIPLILRANAGDWIEVRRTICLRRKYRILTTRLCRWIFRISRQTECH